MKSGFVRTIARLCIGLLMLAGMAGAASAVEPLVDVKWAIANVGKPGIVFVDFQSSKDYSDGHIPGAVNTNYGKDGWRAERKVDKVPDMLPADLGPLAQMIGTKLGIDNDTHVVLVPQGNTALDVGQATRVYWTFKVLGHDKVSILNGGIASYSEDEKAPMDKGIVKAVPKTFKANVRKEMLVSMDDVKKARAAGNILLVDNRPEDQFVGIAKHPKAAVSGTIAGAKNLPNQWLTKDGGGEFRSKAQIEKLYAYAGVPARGEQINFCNTGHWASVGWFASSEIMGNKQSKVYDGSMVEYTMLKGEGIEAKVKLD
jgi:thiosulfate/3-mercaptopyruvate sulfurtransferase